MATSNNNANHAGRVAQGTRHTSSSGRFSYSYAGSGSSSPAPSDPRNAQMLATSQQQRKTLEAAVYGSATGQRAGGVGLVIAGCIVAVPFFVLGLIASIANSAGMLTFFGVGAIGCAALVFCGARKYKLASTFDRYKDLIGVRESCSLDELAASSGASISKVRANLKAMIAKGLLKQASLDESAGKLLLTRNAAERHRLDGEAAAREEHQRNLAASVKEAAAEERPSIAPDKQLVLNRGEGYIAAIREGKGAIAGAGASQTLGQIEQVVRAILDAAADRPEAIGQLDQLMDYYLPTTVKLIESYRELEAQSVQTDSTRKSMREIEGALGSLKTAFEKMLDALFQDKAIDVSADISVLRTILAQDGLTENPFEMPKTVGK